MYTVHKNYALLLKFSYECIKYRKEILNSVYVIKIIL